MTLDEDAATLEALFSRLTADDPTAPADLCEYFLDELTSWLKEHNPAVDEHICATAAEDALLSLIKKPTTFDPKKQSLRAYLHISGEGDLKNLLRTEIRHRSRRADLGAVELSPSMRKYLSDSEADPAKVFDLEELRHQKEQQIASSVPDKVEASLTAKERMALRLMQSKERSTSAYAAILEISDWPAEAQAKEVKRVKDRIKKRLDRAAVE